jgi:hypothetical protein
MFGRARRACVVITAVVAVLIGSSGAAHASESTDEGEWITTENCTTGALTSAAPHPRLKQFIVVQGWAALCGEPFSWDPRAEFAMAHFRPGHGAELFAINLRHFADNPTQPRLIGATSWASPRFGSCLMASFTHRIACAEITVAEDGEISVRPISVDDPLVSAPIEGIEPWPSDGECMSCF